MKSRFKLLPLLLALLIALTAFAACGGDGSSSGTGIGSQASGSGSTSTGGGEEAPEPITLTIGIQAGNCTFGDGIHQEYRVLQDITERTGITLSFVTYDQEKFRVLMAGGDLPDIISVETNSGNQVGSLIESGALLVLDDLLDQYGQNIKERIPVALEWSKNVVGGGQTYLLPTNTNTSTSSEIRSQGWVGFFSRFDVYTAIGAPEINGPDEYLDVLKQMQDHQRAETGDNTIYALSSWSDWGLWPYWVSYPFSYGYESSNFNHLVNLATGEIEHQFIDADGIFWEGMEFINKAYRMGIFDPEGLTMKYDQYMNKAANGTLLTVGANWIEPNAELCGEQAFNAILPGAFPVISELYPLTSEVGYREGGSRAISANCKYPERAMQLLNWFDSEEGARTLANGVKGVDWDVVDGMAQYIGGYLESFKNDSNKDYERENPTGIRGENFATLAQFFTSGSFPTSDGQPIDLTRSDLFRSQMGNVPERYKQLIDTYAPDKGFTIPGQVYDMWIKEGKASCPVEYPLAVELMGQISDTNQQNESKAEAYMSSNIAKVVMAKDEAEFASVKESVIQDILNMGIQESHDEFMQLYEEAVELAKSFGA